MLFFANNFFGLNPFGVIFIIVGSFLLSLQRRCRKTYNFQVSLLEQKLGQVKDELRKLLSSVDKTDTEHK